jgi:hypothetical protein
MLSIKRSRTLSVADILRVVEIARVLVRFDHVACFIINANHGIM